MYALGAGLLGLGPWEFVIILVIVLLIFGPKQLPKLVKTLKSTSTEIRSTLDEIQDEEAAKSAEAPPVAPAPAPVAPAAAPAPVAVAEPVPVAPAAEATPAPTPSQEPAQAGH